MSSDSKGARTALVLSGGGARGAYQAGVMQGLRDLGVLDSPTVRIDTFVGSSAGAINSTMLAAHADSPSRGIDALVDLWSGIQANQIFRTDVRSIGSTGVRWAWDLTFGGAVGGVASKSLLDTSPLREFLTENLPFEQLGSQLEAGALHALALSATDLTTADGVLFLQGQPDVQPWERRRWRIEPTRIGPEHVLASSAIPMLFPSVEIDGRHFGDGSVRNTSPLSPAINLGAEKVIAVSVREPAQTTPRKRRHEAPSIAQIAGVLLDAVMLDAIEVDIDHSERVNRSVTTYHRGTSPSSFRKVDVLWIQPSANFTAVAEEFSRRIPAVVRYVMRGLGSEDATHELSSYLLFDSEFCGRLIEIGRGDVEAARGDIEAFFA
ncbi:MAG: patatin-like phospholipase family protein [Deltaproteobacteria bacterium]|nr:patatin-like phospholipase family protein [Deltaproteobacteria bacterium]MBW2393553.1 patatin-like phospholipase family protein [Deltaproteobacteria bacterium]